VPAVDPTPAWILGIGGFVALGGVAGLAASLVGASNERSNLRAACLALNPKNSDQCTLAAANNIARAQTAADALATWKGVEIASILALGVGAVGAGVGVVLLATRKSRATLSISPSALQLGWQF
jgi:hypothetical protein